MPAKIILTMIVLAIVSACSATEEMPTLLVTDECRYDGPTTMAAGAARLTLQRTGLGDYGAAVVRFQDGHEVSDLENHLEGVTRVWEERPEWVRVRYLVQVDDDDVTSPQGDTVVMDLQPDHYAVVCINYSDDRADVAARLEVVPADP